MNEAIITQAQGHLPRCDRKSQQNMYFAGHRPSPKSANGARVAWLLGTKSQIHAFLRLLFFFVSVCVCVRACPLDWFLAPRPEIKFYVIWLGMVDFQGLPFLPPCHRAKVQYKFEPMHSLSLKPRALSLRILAERVRQKKKWERF